MPLVGVRAELATTCNRPPVGLLKKLDELLSFRPKPLVKPLAVTSMTSLVLAVLLVTVNVAKAWLLVSVILLLVVSAWNKVLVPPAFCITNADVESVAG